MKIQITVNIPDGEYCENCQFAAIDGCENPICTLFGTKLQTACEYYRSSNGNCDDRICCECPNLEHSGSNAKCKKCKLYYSLTLHRRHACKITVGNQELSSTVDKISDTLKAEIQKLNEGLLYICGRCNDYKRIQKGIFR